MDSKSMKIKIRKNIIAKRDTQSEEEIMEKSKIIMEKLLNTDIYKNAKTIFSFISFGTEVFTHDIVKKIIEDNKRVGVPYTYKKSREMTVSEIKDFEKDLEPGYFNILSPNKDDLKPIVPDDIDLVLVPGVAFDRNGYRVGYGGGYYDTFFNKTKDNIIKIGLAFDLQLIEKSPINRFDVAVDYIITEKEIIKI